MKWISDEDWKRLQNPKSEHDTKGNRILSGAHVNPQVRQLHNVKVAQSRKGWKLADVEKAIADAHAGIVYDLA